MGDLILRPHHTHAMKYALAAREADEAAGLRPLDCGWRDPADLMADEWTCEELWNASIFEALVDVSGDVKYRLHISDADPDRLRKELEAVRILADHQDRALNKALKAVRDDQAEGRDQSAGWRAAYLLGGARTCDQLVALGVFERNIKHRRSEPNKTTYRVRPDYLARLEVPDGRRR